MKVNKGSWHYKVVRWTYKFDPMPEKVSLCSYFQRLTILAPLWLIFATPIYAGYFLYWFAASGVLVLVGSLPTVGPFSLKILDDNRRDYALPTIDGVRIYPGVIILIGLPLTVFVWFQFILYRHHGLWIEGIVFLVAALIAGAIIWYCLDADDAIQNETYKLVRARYRAWKDKVCPLIEFVASDSEIVASDSEIEEEGGEK